MNKIKDQLELSIPAARHRRQTPDRNQRRRQRARFWFERMRQIVDHAQDWEPAPPPRDEQMLLADTYRQVLTQAQPTAEPACSAEERHFCE
ncbi:MAG TPA: hypothetical protein VNT26_10895 [Candidatus Sulfotelmatobacter sp.]|nr:hypothetical protein [Candidatus Sulfotelmatobacter sp.]